MTGMLALYAFDELWRVSKFLYYGILALQHRGAGGFKAYSWNGDNIIEYSIDDLTCVSSIDMPGHLAISMVYPETTMSNDTGVMLEKNQYQLAVLAELEPTASTQEEIGVKLINNLERGSSLRKALKSITHLLKNTTMLAVLDNKGEMAVYRGARGLRPMSIGGYGFDMVIASSETSAIDVLGADIKRSLKPGEVLYMTPYNVETFRLIEAENTSICALELIYLSRPDSIIDDVNVYMFRKRLGEELARVFDKDVDAVVGVPETALPYALGFAEASGKKLELGFVSTGHRQRSALKTDPAEKIIAIQLKMNPVKNVFKGKKVAIIDDSLVTGATVKTVVQLLRNKVGAKEVHVLIASPKILGGCPYRIFMLEKKELLAAQLDDDLALKYVEADSVTWIPLDVLRKVAKEFRIPLCSRCFGINGFSGGVHM